MSNKMADAIPVKLVQNLSKLFRHSRITVLNVKFERFSSSHSDKENSKADGNETSEESNLNTEQEVNDAYAAFPDNVNPKTGEKGGPRGPEPTRYGDWERKGRCIDF